MKQNLRSKGQADEANGVRWRSSSPCPRHILPRPIVKVKRAI